LPREYSLRTLLTISILCALAALPLHAQAPRAVAFLAEHYEVSASLDPSAQNLTARATVEFQNIEPSRVVQIELHPNLKVTAVNDASGKPVAFERDSSSPLLVSVTLPEPVVHGGRVTLTFSYSGPLANEENSPVKGVTLAAIHNADAYLLLPARWFPLTNYPSNRYTAIFKLEVPREFAVVGTGTPSAPTVVPGGPSGGRLLYTFTCAKPAAVGTFVAGNLEFHPQQVESETIPVYLPPAAAKTAADYATDVSRAITVFSDYFGPLPDPHLTLAQLPDGTVREFAAPGLLLVSHRGWDPRAGDRALSGLVAAQWWGNEVMPATTADVWISDSLAHYSQALYAEQTAGKEGGIRAVDDFAVGALMYEEAGPIAQAQQFQPFTSDYRSVVLNKGAMVFSMLRTLLGDSAFQALVRDFYTKYQGKTARIEDFEQLAEQKAAALPESTPASTSTSATSRLPMPAAPKTSGFAPASASITTTTSTASLPSVPLNFRAFFAQWLNSTGVPAFKMEFVVLRVPKGFRVVGKIKQDLEVFRMPIQIKVDTEGNPEYKTIEVVGTDSPFSIETFGRPKPGGIRIDPNNSILKSSPLLRTRAAVARGEELAEQGRYYDAITQYQGALETTRNSALAHFRMGEAFFYQKNYMAAANSFREALADVPEPSEKWTEVWSHIYLGKVFDLTGSRERAVNEYSKAKQTNDDTGGAQTEAARLIAKPYSEGGASASTPASAPAGAPAAPPPATDMPVLKKKP
jgi:Peptidase family M1 domain/TPR repeat